MVRVGLGLGREAEKMATITLVTNEPARPYKVDEKRVKLSTKIERHLRNHGWKQRKCDKQWVDPKSLMLHSFRSALLLQITRETRP